MRYRKVNTPLSKYGDIITGHQNADNLFFRGRLVTEEGFIDSDRYLTL
jgi:predicted lipid carrier protein YhbT